MNLDEEEDRDSEVINEFMKRYAKLWRNVFSKYQNQGFKLNKVKDFDQLANAPQISAAEITKLLKEHNCMP